MIGSRLTETIMRLARRNLSGGRQIIPSRSRYQTPNHRALLHSLVSHRNNLGAGIIKEHRQWRDSRVAQSPVSPPQPPVSH